MSSRRRLKSTPAESEKHFVDMAEWITMESKAEIARMEERRKVQNTADAEKSGETILDLVITDHVDGLGGHQLVTFKRRNETLSMPWHRLRVGAPVLVSPYRTDGKAETGVVSRKKRDSLQVALNRWPDADAFRIDLTADEVTRQRQLSAIMVVKDSRGRLGHLRSVMMGEKQPGFSERELDLEFQTHLNDSQQDAVRFALSAEDVAILHGPPGTGKTTTVVELIIQAIGRGERVLACAPSNTAVDNLLERLVLAKQRVVRIGHPARVAERLRNYSLDGLIESHDNMPVIREMLREAESIFRRSEKWSRAKRQRGERQDMRREAKRLQMDAKMLERQAMHSILDRAQVICATTTFNPDMLGDRRFDLAVIDEACQSTEPGCWVPMLCSDRLVMAGDHQQLPPTVLSTEAARQGFATSLMERQMNHYGGEISRMLTVQYRMHREIMDFSSGQFYDGALVAHDSVVEHKLADLEGVESNDFTNEIVTFIDTAGAGWEEELEPNGLSKRNPQEAELVLKKVALLLESGLEAKDIAVIAPYAAQVRLLRDRFEGRGLEIDTVDGFQGREKEAVIISLVRSNHENEIGFLADRRRMNVALTRARRKLLVVGDSATLGVDEFYRSFFEYVETLNGYRTVWEEM
ncbi:MAG: ATP-dependent RNA/DNA helicase IGHMBP2 [Mariniblastus sp.]|jgi:ATP-dependent RNA/DNA helicase IGHMBP2